MNDDIDRANDTMQYATDVAIHNASVEAHKIVNSTGQCIWCSDKVKDEMRWCSIECRDEYQRYKK
jgi:hypothetical protein